MKPISEKCSWLPSHTFLISRSRYFQLIWVDGCWCMVDILPQSPERRQCCLSLLSRLMHLHVDKRVLETAEKWMRSSRGVTGPRCRGGARLPGQWSFSQCIVLLAGWRMCGPNVSLAFLRNDWWGKALFWITCTCQEQEDVSCSNPQLEGDAAFKCIFPWKQSCMWLLTVMHLW